MPGGGDLKVRLTLLLPGLFLILSFAGALILPMLRAALKRHLWISYRTGYGQSVISVLVGAGVMIAAAGFIFWQIHTGAHGGRYPSGAFSGYAAGIGLLLAQAVLVRAIERDPAFRPHIEAP